MSANRKLQSEVDKVMKKIEEGVEVFDEIWDKVYAATQQSLKEKYESDLKKEIKKLQRLRDQIKTWQGNNDIKDKSHLLEAKKLIESKMEQFKVCEKETKTKAFSKEGLAREEKLDPREIEKEKSRSWVQSIIERLDNTSEAWEADIERISSAKGKNKNKDTLIRLEAQVAKNKWHIKTLEQINRMIDNDSLEVEKLDDIKEDIDYYVECMENDDYDCIDEDYNIYEELHLDSLTIGGRSSGSSASHFEKDSNKDSTESSSSSSSSSSSLKQAATITSSGATVGGIAIGKKALPSSSSTASIIASISPAKATKTTKGTKATSKQTTNTPPTTTTSSTSTTSSTTATSSTSANEGSSTSAWATAAKPSTVTSKTPATTSSSTSTSKTVADTNSATSTKGNSKATKSPTPSNTVPDTSSTKPPTASDKSPPPSTPSQESKTTAAGSDSSPRTTTPPNLNAVVGSATKTTEVTNEQPPSQAVPLMQQFPTRQSTSLNQQQQPSDVNATADSGKSQQSPQFGNSLEMQTISNMLKMSAVHLPPASHSIGEQRQKGFTPKNPYNCHPSFPTQQPSVFENPTVFERLPMDALFLAFYYQQGSYQQYLAARQLKKNSWRFHKKYMTWFQRHEEPVVTTDEYEKGTYVYFDYESGWCQRIKSEFTFEYCFLEDELNQPQSS